MNHKLILAGIFVFIQFHLHAQFSCTPTDASGCQCPDNSQECDLLPDLRVSKYSLGTYWGGPKEFSQSGNGEENGKLLVTATTPNTGFGPLEVEPQYRFVCGGDTFVFNPGQCPDGSAPNVIIDQIIYHKSGNQMTQYKKPANSMTYHDSHGHMHVDDWLEFELKMPDECEPDTMKWPTIGFGTKISFCLMDFSSCGTYSNYCLDNNGNELQNSDFPNFGLGRVYTCQTSFQGISSGYIDMYHMYLPDQWIIIPPGTRNGQYVIVGHVDPANNFLESDEDNNTCILPFYLNLQEPEDSLAYILRTEPGDVNALVNGFSIDFLPLVTNDFLFPVISQENALQLGLVTGVQGGELFPNISVDTVFQNSFEFFRISNLSGVIIDDGMDSLVSFDTVLVPFNRSCNNKWILNKNLLPEKFLSKDNSFLIGHGEGEVKLEVPSVLPPSPMSQAIVGQELIDPRTGLIHQVFPAEAEAHGASVPFLVSYLPNLDYIIIPHSVAEGLGFHPEDEEINLMVENPNAWLELKLRGMLTENQTIFQKGTLHEFTIGDEIFHEMEVLIYDDHDLEYGMLGGGKISHLFKFGQSASPDSLWVKLPCSQVNNLNVTDLTATQATISWESDYPLKNVQLAYKAQAGLWNTHNLEASSLSLTDLVPGETYFIKIKDRCDGLNSTYGWSDIDTFVTDSASCSPIFNNESQQINQISQILSWENPTGIPLFQVAWKEKSGLWKTYNTSISSFLAINLIPDTLYYWKVKDLCDSTQSTFGWTNTLEFRTGSPPCPMPNNIQIDSIQSQTANCSWDVSDSLNPYQLAIRKIGGFWRTQVVFGGFFKVMDLLPGTNYELKIKDLCKEGGSSFWGFSNPVTFTTPQGNCSPPEDLIASSITSSSADLEWMVSSPVSEFQVAIKEPWGLWTTFNVDTTYFQMTNLGFNKTYVWKVKDRCESPASTFGWVEMDTFMTLGFGQKVSGDDGNISIRNVELASEIEVFGISFEALNNARVVDINGRQILISVSGNNNSLRIRFSNEISQGIYFLSCEMNNGEVENLKFSIL